MQVTNWSGIDPKKIYCGKFLSEKFSEATCTHVSFKLKLIENFIKCKKIKNL